MLLEIPQLSPAEREQLIDFLDSELVDSEQLYDYCGTHGFLTAVCISPQPMPVAQWWPILFPISPKYRSETEAQQFRNRIERLQQEIDYQLSHDLPNAPFNHSSPAQREAQAKSWATGFIEALLAQEDAWLMDDNPDVGELLLPVFVWSEIIDEPAYHQLHRNKKQASKLLKEIPQMAIDLYLLFRADE